MEDWRTQLHADWRTQLHAEHVHGGGPERLTEAERIHIDEGRSFAALFMRRRTGLAAGVVLAAGRGEERVCACRRRPELVVPVLNHDSGGCGVLQENWALDSEATRHTITGRQLRVGPGLQGSTD